GGLRRALGPALETLEKSTHAVDCHETTLTYEATGSACSRRDGRGGGSNAASTSAPAAAAAATYIAARRASETATAPNATGPTPRRPTEGPIERPDAMPIRLGRYSWAITIVTPKVLITEIPTPASAIAPTAPPTATNTRISGGVTAL